MLIPILSFTQYNNIALNIINITAIKSLFFLVIFCIVMIIALNSGLAKNLLVFFPDRAGGACDGSKWR